MTHDRLLDLHSIVCKEAQVLIDKKNSDYCPADNALRSLKEFGQFGVLVRLHDKLGRLRTIRERKGARNVMDESERDTVLDAINYLVLYLALKEEEQGDCCETPPSKKEIANAENKAMFGVNNLAGYAE